MLEKTLGVVRRIHVAAMLFTLFLMLPEARSQGPARGVLQTTRNSISLPVRILGDLTIEQSPDGGHLRLSGFVAGGAPGDPELPFCEFRFLLPADVAPDRVRASLEEPAWEDVPGAFDVAPVRPAATRIDGKVVLAWGGKDPSIIFDGRDVTIYGADAPFPATPLGRVTPSKYRQWNMGAVSLTPVAYNPVQKRLRLLRSAVIRIAFERRPKAEGAAPEAVSAPPRSDKFWKRIASRLENPGDRATFYPSLAATSSEPGTSNGGPDYMIVTTSYIKDNSAKFDAFVAHKAKLGHTVATIVEGGAEDDSHYRQGATASERATNVRSWLQSRYSSWGIEYALLIGDPHPSIFTPNRSIPMLLCYPDGGNDNSTPTDMCFAELSGNWDADGDGKPGEWGTTQDFQTGGIDRNCEIGAGRIPFYGSFPDLDKILQKIIDYESGAEPQTWRKKLLIPAAISNFGPEDDNNDGDATDPGDIPSPSLRTFGADWGESLKALAGTAGYSPYTLYEKTGVYSNGSAYPLTACDADLTQPNIQTEWQKHYGFVAWWGHGSATGAFRLVWTNDSVRPDGITQRPEETLSPTMWSSSNCSSLPDDYPSFVVQVSCTNGSPESSGNLGYSLLKNGAIGTFSASRVSWYAVGSWNLYAALSVGDNASYAYYVFNRMAVEGDSAAEALNYCRANFGTGWGFQSWMNELDFNLYGAPDGTPDTPLAPVVDLNGGAAGIDYNATYVEDAGDAAIGAGGATVTDADSANLSSITITLTNPKDGDMLTAAGGGAVVVTPYTSATGVLTLSGTASTAAYQSALRTVRFITTADPPDATQRAVTVVANDGLLNSQSAQSLISVVSVNDAPVITAPVSTTTTEDTPLVFSTANGAQIRVSDADAGAAGIQTSLVVAHGKATLATTAGLAVVGDDSGNVSMTGAQGDINNALNGLRFEPAEDFDGAASIQVSANDLGSTGSGGAKTGLKTIDIAVVARADTPSLTVSDAAGEEDTTIPLTLALSLNDTDGSENLSIAIAGVPPGATLSAGTNNGFGRWTLTSAQLTSLTLTPAPNSDRDFGLTVMAESMESSNYDTASTIGSISVAVAAVADTPTLSLSDAAGDEDTAIPLTIGASSTDGDGSEALSIEIDGVPSSATLSKGADSGGGRWSLSPAQLAGLTFTPPLDADNDLALTVTATAVERANGASASASGVVNVTVRGINDTPVVDLNGAAPGLNYGQIFVASAGALGVTSNAATITDVDSPLLTSMTIALANHLDGSSETLSAAGGGGVVVSAYDSTAGLLLLNGPAPAFEFQNTLRSLTYDNTATTPTPIDRTIEIVAFDGTTNSLIARSAIFFGGMEHAPSVEILPVATVCASPVEIGFVLTDAESSPCTVFALWKSAEETSSTWTTATLTADTPATFSSAFCGMAHTLKWDARTDVGDVDTTGAQFRLMASDGLAMGAPDVSNGFGVDTKSPIVESVTRMNAAISSGGRVQFLVAYSEDIRNVEATDFALRGSGAVGASVEEVCEMGGDASVYRVTVNTGADGDLHLDTVLTTAPTTICDVAGNALANALDGGDPYIVDSSPPESEVTAPNGTTDSTLLTVRWSFGDPAPTSATPSGVASVEVFWSRNGGGVETLGVYPPATRTALFDAKTRGGDGIYRFYSAALDAAGNAEPAPAGFDVSVVVDTVDPASAVEAWPRY